MHASITNRWTPRHIADFERVINAHVSEVRLVLEPGERPPEHHGDARVTRRPADRVAGRRPRASARGRRGPSRSDGRPPVDAERDAGRVAVEDVVGVARASSTALRARPTRRRPGRGRRPRSPRRAAGAGTGPSLPRERALPEDLPAQVVAAQELRAAGQGDPGDLGWRVGGGLDQQRGIGRVEGEAAGGFARRVEDERARRRGWSRPRSHRDRSPGPRRASEAPASRPIGSRRSAGRSGRVPGPGPGRSRPGGWPGGSARPG